MPGGLPVGLIAAQAAFAATFRGPRDRFWQRMTLTGLSLGALALVVSHVTWDIWIFLVQPTGEVAPVASLNGTSA